MNEFFDKGHALYGEVFGAPAADQLKSAAENSEGFGPLQSQWALDFAFGQIWTREEQLPRKLRSFTVLGMLIAQRQFDEIKYHVRMGVANGMTRQELEEVFYTALAYGGFPMANSGKKAMLEALAEMEAEGQTIP